MRYLKRKEIIKTQNAKGEKIKLLQVLTRWNLADYDTAKRFAEQQGLKLSQWIRKAATTPPK